MENRERLSWIVALGVIPMAIFWTPYFYDQFITSKWLVFHSIVLVCGIAFIGFKDPKYPVLPKQFQYFLASAGIFALISLLINSQDNYLTDFKDALSFLMIFFVTLQLKNSQETFIRRLNFCFQFSTVIVSFVALGQYMGFSVQGLVMPHPNLFSTFGNKNMAGEYIGFALVFHLFSYVSLKNKKSRYGLISAAVLLIGLTYFYFLFARAAIVGVATAGITVALFNEKYRWKIIGAGSILVFAGSIFLYHNIDLTNWQSSTAIRIVRWINTLHMIIDNPLGIGLDNYGFEYVPYAKDAFMLDTEYSERHLIRSPHNGFLEMAVELGIGTLIAFLGFLYLLIFSVFKKVNFKKHWDQKDLMPFLPVALLIYIMTDTFFAFPMELPFPFYTTAIVFGLVFNQSFEQKTFDLRLNIPLQAAFFVTVLMCVPYAISKIAITDRASYTRSKLACKADPSFWFTCLHYSQLQLFGEEAKTKEMRTERHISYENLVDAEVTVLRLLKYNPSNFLAIKKLSYIYKDLGRLDLACDYYKDFKQRFGEKNTLTKSGWDKLCAEYLLKPLAKPDKKKNTDRRQGLSNQNKSDPKFQHHI